MGGSEEGMKTDNSHWHTRSSSLRVAAAASAPLTERPQGQSTRPQPKSTSRAWARTSSWQATRATVKRTRTIRGPASSTKSSWTWTGYLNATCRGTTGCCRHTPATRAIRTSISALWATCRAWRCGPSVTWRCRLARATRALLGWRRRGVGFPQRGPELSAQCSLAPRAQSCMRGLIEGIRLVRRGSSRQEERGRGRRGRRRRRNALHGAHIILHTFTACIIDIRTVGWRAWRMGTG